MGDPVISSPEARRQELLKSTQMTSKVLEPKSFLEIKPFPAPSHIGLKITTRSGTPSYACELPRRNDVAKKNYERRRQQVLQCGYHSANYKPYKEVGCVELDSKRLILNALGQEEKSAPAVVIKEGKRADEFNDLSSHISNIPMSGPANVALENDGVESLDSSGMLRKSIHSQIRHGLHIMKKVQLGQSLFKVMDDEKQRKAALLNEARKRREKERRVRARKAVVNADTDSDDQDQSDITRYIVRSPARSGRTSEASRSEANPLDGGDSTQSPTYGVAWQDCQARSLVDRISQTVNACRWQQLQKQVASVNCVSTSRNHATGYVVSGRVDADGTRTRPDLGVEATEVAETASTLPDSSAVSQASNCHGVYEECATKSSSGWDGSHSCSSSAAQREGAASGMTRSEWGGISDVQKVGKKYRRNNLPRPFSPIYTNLNFYEAASSEALFRQLCVVNWILEGMSQDNNPPVMSMISQCWKLNHLKADGKSLRLRVEREKVADPLWRSFLANPKKFQSRTPRRIHGRRLTSSNASQSVSFQDQKRRGLDGDDAMSTSSGASRFSGFARSLPADDSAQAALFDASKTHRRLSNVSEKPPLQFVGGADTGNSSPLKNRRWEKLQRSFNLKNASTDVIQDDRRGKPHNSARVAMDARQKFEDMKEEQAVVLHDSLERYEKKSMRQMAKKFLALTVANNMYKSLQEMRTHGRISDDESESEELARLRDDCLWYKNLLQKLPQQVTKDRNFELILNKIGRFGNLEGRKLSEAHFLRCLSLLRPFELCYPNISAAIEFVRDKIVEMDKVVFETWVKKHIYNCQRSKSAPASRLVNTSTSSDKDSADAAKTARK